MKPKSIWIEKFSNTKAKEKSEECPECKLIVHSRSLKRHIVTVHGIRPLKISTVEKKEQCLECGVLYLARNMKWHMLKVHGIGPVYATPHKVKFLKKRLPMLEKMVESIIRKFFLFSHVPIINLLCLAQNESDVEGLKNTKIVIEAIKGLDKKTADFDFCDTACKILPTSLVCQFCSKSYSSPGSLMRHERLHSDEKCTCEICGFSCKSSAYLSSHMRVHNILKKEFLCILCNKGFSSTRTLFQHRSKIHNVDKNIFVDNKMM